MQCQQSVSMIHQTCVSGAIALLSNWDTFQYAGLLLEHLNQGYKHTSKTLLITKLQELT